MFNNFYFVNNVFVTILGGVMNNISYWEDEEVKTLFKFVQIKKSEGVPLIKIFNLYGKCTGRCQNSVRNYYYREVKELLKNKQRQQKLGIQIDCHVARTPVPFTAVEKEKIINSINNMVKNGYSVRKACLTLAGGDASKMIRYQNKYRSNIKKVKENTSVDNIIKMPEQRNLMTDEDIKALFMGILKLVKKQETLRAKDLAFAEVKSANEKLKIAMAEIIAKSQQIEKLQSKISLLKQEIETFKQKEINSRIELNKNTAKNLIKSFLNQKQQTKDVNLSK